MQDDDKTTDEQTGLSQVTKSEFVVKGVGETGDSSDENSADEDVLPR